MAELDDRLLLEKSTGPATMASGYPNGVQVGGIGTGRIELDHNGQWGFITSQHNWPHPVKGFSGNFFALACLDHTGNRTFHLLQKHGYAGVPGVSVVEYNGLHPIAEVKYHITGVPIRTTLTAFSPLIPHDLPNSSIPGVVAHFRLHNVSLYPMLCTLYASWENINGCGGNCDKQIIDRNGNTNQPLDHACLHGVVFNSGERTFPLLCNCSGEYVLATPKKKNVDVQILSSFNACSSTGQLLQGLAKDGAFASFPQCGSGIEGSVHPAGLMAISVTVLPDGHVEIPVVVAWHMPHLYCERTPELDHGAYYHNRFSNAVAVAQDLLDHFPDYLARTREWHNRLLKSDLPRWLAEKAINDTTPLTTNSIIIKSGKLYTLEASRGMGGALGTIDQRLVSHAGYALFFPSLNRTELVQFAQQQQPDGHIPHFIGNIHLQLNTPDVPYGDTTWPDLSCSFIIQCYRDLITTGEQTFFDQMVPCIMKAYAWLISADEDGDGVPEGGSSWDTEHYGGLFSYTGSLWLATLRVMEKIAQLRADSVLEYDVANRYGLAYKNVVDGLWNGTYFNKFHNPVTHETSNDIFMGQIGGEWVVRMLGLEGIYPHERIISALATIYANNCNQNRFVTPPIQVTQKGLLPDRKDAEQAWPQYSMVFVDCLALLAGMPDQGFAAIRQFDRLVRDVCQNPWATTLWHDSRIGLPMWNAVDCYMNGPAIWLALDAVTGFAANEIDHSLTFGKPVPGPAPSMRYPVFTPRYWATLTSRYTKKSHTITFVADRFFSGTTVSVEKIRLREQCGSVVVTLRGKKIQIEIVHTSTYTEVFLDKSYNLTTGNVLSVMWTNT